VWAEFSSNKYKAKERMAPVTPLLLDVPVFEDPRFPKALREQPVHVEFDPPGGGRGYYRTPSLIGLWATAPYLHNNSVGRYAVVLKDGKKGWVENDGRRVGNRLPDGTWDCWIDVSVEGRLRMFQDGMDQLLNPEKRQPWIKRTSVECAL